MRKFATNPPGSLIFAHEFAPFNCITSKAYIKSVEKRDEFKDYNQ